MKKFLLLLSFTVYLGYSSPVDAMMKRPQHLQQPTTVCSYLQHLDAKLDQFTSNMSSRLDRMDQRLTGLEEKLDQTKRDIDQVKSSIGTFDCTGTPSVTSLNTCSPIQQQYGQNDLLKFKPDYIRAKYEIEHGITIRVKMLKQENNYSYIPVWLNANCKVQPNNRLEVGKVYEISRSLGEYYIYIGSAIQFCE